MAGIHGESNGFHFVLGMTSQGRGDGEDMTDNPNPI